MSERELQLALKWWVAEKDLADDLADVLSRMVVGWQNVIGHDLAQHPDVQRVMARYREARGV